MAATAKGKGKGCGMSTWDFQVSSRTSANDATRLKNVGLVLLKNNLLSGSLVCLFVLTKQLSHITSYSKLR